MYGRYISAWILTLYTRKNISHRPSTHNSQSAQYRLQKFLEVLLYKTRFMHINGHITLVASPEIVIPRSISYPYTQLWMFYENCLEVDFPKWNTNVPRNMNSDLCLGVGYIYVYIIHTWGWSWAEDMGIL